MEWDDYLVGYENKNFRSKFTSWSQGHGYFFEKISLIEEGKKSLEISFVKKTLTSAVEGRLSIIESLKSKENYSDPNQNEIKNKRCFRYDKSCLNKLDNGR